LKLFLTFSEWSKCENTVSKRWLLWWMVYEELNTLPFLFKIW